jgi:L-fucose isomerase-like protein
MNNKAKIKVLFTVLEKNEISWPYINYDYDKRANQLISQLTKSLPNIDFSFSMLTTEQTEEFVKQDQGQYQGYVIFMLTLWNDVIRKIMELGKPVILIDDLYGGSGGVLSLYSTAKEKKLPVVAVASSDFRDTVDAVKLFDVINKTRNSKILSIADQSAGMGGEERSNVIKNMFGTDVSIINSNKLNEYYEQTDETQAQKWQKLWIEQAEKVAEPSEQEILKSARMYLAIKQLMEDYQADAVTVDCLGLFYAGKLPAYPCLTFFQLNNDGLTGVCENDFNSTITQLILRHLANRPGFVSDPVIDTASNQIIYAHCVATNKVYGPQGATNPYIIRSHSEDRKGAAVQSLLPLGKKITTVKINPSTKAMAIHSAKTVANIEEDKGCRTKLAAETNAKAILNNWDNQFGWHRVTAYGDYREDMLNIATLLGLKTIEEDIQT